MIFQEDKAISKKKDVPQTNELLQQKSEMSFFVSPNTQVSKEPPSSQIDTVSVDDDEHSTATITTVEISPKEKQEEKEPLIQVIISSKFLLINHRTDR